MTVLKRHVLLVLGLLSLATASCTKDGRPDLREEDYGYVQFKVYKEASYEQTKAVVPELDYLHDAAKVLVMLQYGDVQISQTMILGAADDEDAEYGLRSEKLRLVKGEYKVNAFTLFDKLDEELYNGGAAGSFEVVAGGLTSHDILAKTVERGKVRFTLTKNFIGGTKAASREFTFDEIRKVDIIVKEVESGVRTSFSKLKASFSTHFDESGTGFLTSSSVCDSLVSLKGGKYVVDAYSLYDSAGKLLETASGLESETFTVLDNTTTDAKVPVTMRLADEYIRDYYALKAIWESLDGPNWYYSGEDWPEGSNWNFNKSVDLWGDQPGVQLHPNGRVALINISDRSLPEEIGELSKLEYLYISNGELSTLPSSFGRLESLTDLELYNNPRMTSIPEVLGELPELISVNLGNNFQMGAGEIEKAIEILANGASAGKIQILYLNKNNISRIDGSLFRKFKKLGLLDLADNNISEITEAFGQDIGIVQLYLDNNKLSSLPVDENGLFMRIDDVETFSVMNNLFTELPDIFTTDTPFIMGSVNFAYNHISGVQNAGSGYKGLRVETLTLNNNAELTEFPAAFMESGSLVSNFAFRGCSLETIPGEALVGETSKYIVSMDLSYNHLSKLPKELNAVNIPYLYGIDLSYNRFSSFPFEPLDSAYLTVFGIRGQRSASGKRCLSEWPTGLYNHKGLRGFYIGSNNLGKVDDTISTLCYYLDISDNPNIVFDASDICTAFATGVFFLIYDKTQDIRGCAYIPLD